MLNILITEDYYGISNEFKNKLAASLQSERSQSVDGDVLAASITYAPSIPQAVDYAQERRYDVAVIDPTLDGIDRADQGSDLMRTLKRQGIPVIFLMNSHGAEELGLNGDAFDTHHTRPYDGEKLAQQIHELLSGREAPVPEEKPLK